MSKRITILLMLLILMTMASVMAQDITQSTVVEVEATDGLKLVGDYYALSTADAKPTVTLLHMLGSTRKAWEPLLPALLDAGYNVLNVDLRGHGETGGSVDWEAAVTDVQTWLDWLRAQDSVRGDAISIVGASIGSNLALIGCANDEQCMTAVALSPGLDYRGIMPEEAVVDGLRQRSALLMAAQGDKYSADSVKTLITSAKGEVGVRLYTGSVHGTEMFTPRIRERVINVIVSWLNEHTPEG